MMTLNFYIGILPLPQLTFNQTHTIKGNYGKYTRIACVAIQCSIFKSIILKILELLKNHNIAFKFAIMMKTLIYTDFFYAEDDDGNHFGL